MECVQCFHPNGIHTLECPNNDTKRILSTRKWCDAEETVILNMVQNGSDHKTISGFINRSLIDLTDRFKLIAIKLYDAGQTDPNIISKLTGLSLGQIHNAIENRPCKHCSSFGYSHAAECPRNNILYNLLNDRDEKISSRHGFEWTGPEEELMLSMSKRGCEYKKIAKCLSRTPAAINARFSLMVERLYKAGQTDPGILSETTGLCVKDIETIIRHLKPKPEEIVKSMTFEQGETIIELLKELKQMLTKPVRPVRPLNDAWGKLIEN